MTRVLVVLLLASRCLLVWEGVPAAKNESSQSSPGPFSPVAGMKRLRTFLLAEGNCYLPEVQLLERGLLQRRFERSRIIEQVRIETLHRGARVDRNAAILPAVARAPPMRESAPIVLASEGRGKPANFAEATNLLAVTMTFAPSTDEMENDPSLQPKSIVPCFKASCLS